MSPSLISSPTCVSLATHLQQQSSPHQLYCRHQVLVDLMQIKASCFWKAALLDYRRGRLDHNCLYHVVWHEHSWPGILLTNAWLCLALHQPPSPFKSRTEGFMLDRCPYKYKYQIMLEHSLENSLWNPKPKSSQLQFPQTRKFSTTQVTANYIANTRLYN